MHGLEAVKDMDVITFNAVVAIVTKLVYREKVEDAWTGMIAAQGTKESMDKLTSAWLRVSTGGESQATPASQPASTSGARAFMQALKIGPKGGSF